MKNKSFAVIGLGQFGMTLAVTLAESDCDVLAIDDKEENIEEISEKVTYAVKADVREPGILKALGVQNVDVAIIAVAENLEASISATMQAKDLGVPFVVAKSMNSLHGRILDKIGADKIIYPEQAMGLRVARNLLSGGYLDVFELSAEFSMAEFSIPESWVGKSLKEIDVRAVYNVNVIAIIQSDGNVMVMPKVDYALQEADHVKIIGSKEDVAKLLKEIPEKA